MISSILRRFVIAAAVALSCATPVWAQNGTLVPLGTTYGRAQVTAWINDAEFAVSRWDGSLTVFRPPQAGEWGPVLTQSTAAPSLQPIQMITDLSPSKFVTSNDAQSLQVWSKLDNTSKYLPVFRAAYDAQLGTADSGAAFAWNGANWLVTGHENGYVAIWKVYGPLLVLEKTMSIRSPDPIPSPFQLWNVRGISYWQNGIVVTGSEDGDLTLIQIPDGTVLTRVRYSPIAQRGINAISVQNDYLVVANCSVGSADRNLWLYRIANNQIAPLHSINLIQDTTRPQVFNFSVQLDDVGGQLYFVASTEEGLLWFGNVVNDELAALSSTPVAEIGGAALSVRDETDQVASGAFDISLFAISPGL